MSMKPSGFDSNPSSNESLHSRESTFLERGVLNNESKRFSKPVLLRVGPNNTVIVVPSDKNGEMTATSSDKESRSSKKIVLGSEDLLNTIQFGRAPAAGSDGRSKAMTLVDPSGETSRRHGSIRRESDGSFSVEDTSTNGTSYSELAIPVDVSEGERIIHSKEFYVAPNNPVHIKIGGLSAHVLVVSSPTAEHPGKVSVAWESQGVKQQRDYLDGIFSLNIGRDPNVIPPPDILFPMDSSVSRIHGVLEYNNGYLKVVDRNSTFGTFVRSVGEEFPVEKSEQAELVNQYPIVNTLEANIRPENLKVGQTDNGAGFAFLTFEGRRPYQEDRIVVHQSPDKKKTSICVADGMGGHGNGDKAAQTFSETMLRSYQSQEFVAGYKRLERAQLAISQNAEIPNGAGLVYVEMLFDSTSPDIEVIHQGDARAMQFTSDGAEVNRTTDHNSGGSEVYRGVVKGKFDQYSHQKDHDNFTRQPKNVYIAASDGVWDNISEERVAYLIRVSNHIGDPVQRAQQIAREMTNNVIQSMDGLVTAGDKPGNRDNITLYVHIEP